jgi:peptidoglycan LD-endopeptidase CwlK
MAVDLKNIKPELKKKMEMAQRAWSAAGLNVIITQGYRTPEYQNSLYAQGRTKPGKIITNATGRTSLHCQGKAFDVAFIDGKKVTYNGDWKKLGELGIKCGLDWGGAWKGFVDKPHFQIN